MVAVQLGTAVEYTLPAFGSEAGMPARKHSVEYQSAMWPKPLKTVPRRFGGRMPPAICTSDEGGAEIRRSAAVNCTVKANYADLLQDWAGRYRAPVFLHPSAPKATRQSTLHSSTSDCREAAYLIYIYTYIQLYLRLPRGCARRLQSQKIYPRGAGHLAPAPVSSV